PTAYDAPTFTPSAPVTRPVQPAPLLQPGARARGLLAPEDGGTPLALRGQAFTRVRAALYAVEKLLQVLSPIGSPLLGHPLHERFHGADRERRVVRDLARELRDGALEAQGGDHAIPEPEPDRRLGRDGLRG